MQDVYAYLPFILSGFLLTVWLALGRWRSRSSWA